MNKNYVMSRHLLFSCAHGGNVKRSHPNYFLTEARFPIWRFRLRKIIQKSQLRDLEYPRPPLIPWFITLFGTRQNIEVSIYFFHKKAITRNFQ